MRSPERMIRSGLSEVRTLVMKARVRVSAAQGGGGGGLRVAAEAGARGEVEVGDLEDFELAVFVDVEGGFVFGDGGAAAEGEEGVLVLAAGVGEGEWMWGDLPAGAGFDGVRAEEDVYGGDGAVAVGFTML